VPVWESNGKYGGAFNFETPDFITGDSILVYHSNSLNPDGNDFAMLFWFKCDYCLDTDIARKGCTETHAGGGWYKMEIGGYGAANLISLQFNTAGTDDATLEYNVPVCDSAWHFAVGQRVGNTAQLYLDGARITSFTGNNDSTLSGTISNPANLTIGSKDTQNDDFFRGLIDEFAIFKSSFSAAQIQQLYMTNLSRYDLNNWSLAVNQKKSPTQGLDDGTYSYFVSATDTAWNSGSTETRSITVNTAVCGNDLIEGTETCDGNNLNGQSCQLLGYDYGTLACLPDCSGFNATGCGNYECGNGVKEGTEQCDNPDFGGANCESLGFIGGTLNCFIDCTFDTSNCTANQCGDAYCNGSIGENCLTCPTDCISGQFAVCGDSVCQGSAFGETCSTCSADCRSGSTAAGTCSACWKGRCDGSCNTTKENSTCYDCNPGSSYCCGDGTCSNGENALTCAVDCGGSVPAPYSSCCGDNVCNGSENVGNCLTDCGCTLSSECDDGKECTADVCNAGACENTPVAENTSCTGGVCCGGNCSVPVCSTGGQCSDGIACTTDICANAGTCGAACSNIWPGCGLSDGCCSPGCGSSDSDCPQPTCSACFKGKCDGTCNPAKEGSNCLDCAQ